VGLARNQGLHVLLASALSHRALAEYVRGQEQAAVTLATEALQVLGAGGTGVQWARARAGLVLRLCALDERAGEGLGTPAPDGTEEGRLHTGDPCARFWQRTLDARLAMLHGAVPEATRILTTPCAPLHVSEAELPPRLRVAWLVERGLLAALSWDEPSLKEAEQSLAALDARGGAHLLAGLRSELRGDRRAAAESFDRAVAEATYNQPPIRAMALVCRAQVLAAAGSHADALDLLEDAATATEVRRTALPFLGWSRLGAPVGPMLSALERRSTSAWVQRLASLLGNRPGIAVAAARSTPTPRERRAATDRVVGPALSPREQEVLVELARGATYADIAADLVVSENTVKSHISSLYTKLGASRRSEALATARSLRLI
jgi:DNA-binding CsgD family transcriptional regulator